MAELVKQAGSIAGAGRAYAAARGLPGSSGERMAQRWVAGARPTPRAALGLLRALERDERTPAERAAFVELARARASRLEDVFTGRPAAWPAGRPVEGLAALEA